MQVAPAIKNAMNETIESLKKDGHEIVEFKFPNLYKFRNFFIQILAMTQFVENTVKRLGKEHELSQTVGLFEKAKYGGLFYKIKQLISSSEGEKLFYKNFNCSKGTLDLLGAIAEKDFYE